MARRGRRESRVAVGATMTPDTEASLGRPAPQDPRVQGESRFGGPQDQSDLQASQDTDIQEPQVLQAHQDPQGPAYQGPGPPSPQPTPDLPAHLGLLDRQAQGLWS